MPIKQIMNSHKPYFLSKQHLQKTSGFTLIELMVVVGLISIVAAVSIPSFIAWMPKYRLKSATRDVYSTLQHARLLAVRRNINVKVIFDNTVNPGFYFIDLNGDGLATQPGETRTDLSWYGSGVDFSVPAGLVNWNGTAVASSSTFSASSPPPPFCTYNSNGTSGTGSIYLTSTANNAVYAVTTVTSGAIKVRIHDGSVPYTQSTNWK